MDWFLLLQPLFDQAETPKRMKAVVDPHNQESTCPSDQLQLDRAKTPLDALTLTQSNLWDQKHWKQPLATQMK